MKAFLLAAGEGTRLRPLTTTTPKCLVPIRGEPLLSIWLRLFDRAGIEEVLINLHHLPDQVRGFLGRFESRVRVVPRYEPELLGSAGTVAANRDFVAGERDFLVAYADNLTNLSVAEIRDFHRERDAIVTIGVTETDRPREKGILVVDGDDNVTAFEEKPDEPRSNLANAGVYVARPELLDLLQPLDSGEPLDFGYHVLPRLAGRANVFRISSFLTDIGTPQAYERVQRSWPGL